MTTINVKMIIRSLLFFTLVSLVKVNSQETPLKTNPLSYQNVIYEWKQLDYKFPSEQTRSRLLKLKSFIPENNIITGVKVKENKIYLTVPRWKEGVPSTLNYVEFNPSEMEGETFDTPKEPKLIPYPSWEMNQLGNCKALQYVQSVEIDQFNRLWAIDVGRVHILAEKPDNKCPPKLVIFDLATGSVLRKYEFPSSVVSPTTNFLNDIVVGCTTKEDCYAYITDARDAKVVIYDYQEDRSWYVHHRSMLAEKDAEAISILGNNYSFMVNVDGIALAPKDRNFDRLYYSPLTSYNLYSVPTSVLQTAVNGITLEDSDITNHGKKSSQSDGLVMDANGLIFYGLLNSNGVASYKPDSNMKLPNNEYLIVRNNVELQWPDSLAFDDAGYLYIISNRLQNMRGNKYNPKEVNFRVSRVYIGSPNYMNSASVFKAKQAEMTIPPSVLDATAKTNLNPSTKDEQREVRPETPPKEHYHQENGDKHSLTSNDMEESGHHDHDQETGHVHMDHEAMKTESNSSLAVNPYSGTLVFVIAVFVFHPVI